MALPQAIEGIGNMLRLQGLKNVSGRRKILPGAEYLDNLNPKLPDITGTGSRMNLPQIDTGAGLSPQSYDVRANEILPDNTSLPEMQAPDNENVLSRFGRALGMQVKKGELPSGPAAPQAPPIATQQVDMSEGLPPISASQQVGQQPDSGEIMRRLGSSLKERMNPFNVPPQTTPTPEVAPEQYAAPAAPEATPGFWGAIKDYFNPEKREEMSRYNDQLRKNAQTIAEKPTPGVFGEVKEYFRPEKQEEATPVTQQSAQTQQVDQADLDQAQQNPWEVAVYGATDTFANSPELVKEFQQYTGVDFSPQTQELTSKYEKVLGDIDKGINAEGAGYDEQAARIKERILSNQATDMDKYYIGMALLMPLLIGGVFGKEAGLGALGGGAKGMADIYARRAKDTREDEELLADVNKAKTTLGLKRGELELEKLKIPIEVKKLLPEDLTKDLKGMNMVTLKDPETGDTVAQGPEVFPDLVANLTYYNTPHKRDKLMLDNAEKIEEEKNAVYKANNATRDIINAISQVQDPGVLGKIFSLGLSEGPGALKKAYRSGLLGNVPMIKDENGRSVNAAVYLDSKLEQIKDAYRRNENMRNYTDTIAQHVGAMAENPLYSGITADDLTTQMLILRDRAQQSFIERVKSKGFYSQPLENTFGKQNRELYAPLNAKEEKKQLEEDKRKLLLGD